MSAPKPDTKIAKATSWLGEYMSVRGGVAECCLMLADARHEGINKWTLGNARKRLGLGRVVAPALVFYLPGRREDAARFAARLEQKCQTNRRQRDSASYQTRVPLVIELEYELAAEKREADRVAARRAFHADADAAYRAALGVAADGPLPAKLGTGHGPRKAVRKPRTLVGVAAGKPLSRKET